MSHQPDDDVRRVSWPQHHHHQHSPFVQVPGDLHSTLPPTPHQIAQPLSPPTTTVFGMPPSPPQQSSPPNICYSSGHPETYSVLPVGHGNFLKVYHSADSEQPQIIYNSYELFASNTITQPTPPPQHTANPRGAALSDDTLVMDGMHSVPNQPPGFGGIESAATTTNMIINKLVNNWSPNLTGTYTQFGEQSATASPIKSFVAANNALIQEGHYTAVVDDGIQGVSPNASPSPVNQPKLKQNEIVNLTKTNGSFESNNGININPAPEVKKRIIAEVKPMRMSYSDVLSKINSQAVVGTPNGGANIPSSHGMDTVVQSTKSPKPSAGGAIEKTTKASAFPTERKFSPTSDDRERIDSRSAGNRKQTEQQSTQQTSTNSTQLSSAGQQRGEKKRSPTHENKENIQNFSASLNKGTKKNTSKPQKASSKQAPATLPGGEFTKKRSSKREEDQNTNNGSKSTSNVGKSSNTAGVNDKEGYYNVAKTDNTYERPQKYASQHNSTSTRKSRQSNGISFGSKMSSSRFDKQQQMYSSNRRGQNRGAQKSGTNKYELMKKFFDKWLLEYTIKILTWLFYLIYDIVVLGFSMVYERLVNYYASGYAYFLVLRKDLKNNSNKPSIWVRNYLKRIDNKFKKNSKWAFWRRFYKKKPVENSTEFYKNGRLPQTGEEAMYSLLNCKGKDAYSILGVPANSSQEQIRKHYKKIAVLVHPDKNKQPGAEEAFKVLQRAFELIGEPENRAAYDQSLVEALHAEKAWTELHDLLSQLQTKIAEAANTIRCSSCGLRHPRKMTDRPHYAARECGSCKIRHSAREGDIWAETSWLRLRWKYLALMEGKVYDITEWANCQKGALSHLEPNSHMVQYRIVRGGQQQQQQQSQQQQQQQQQQKQQNSQQEKGKFKREPPSEATLDDFLDNLYSGQNPHGQPQSSTRRRARRN